LHTFIRESEHADVPLIEGVMGLFDGADPTSNAGSTAEIARWLEAPVILFTDASAMFAVWRR
jgi:cobyrinic acid a,c-diamide synthase